MKQSKAEVIATHIYNINVLEMNITHISNYIYTTNRMNDFNNLSHNEVIHVSKVYQNVSIFQK